MELGKLKVGPPPSRGKGLGDDILGKKSLAKTMPQPLGALKPLGTNNLDANSGDSLAKTQPFTRKTVRLANPLESVPVTMSEPIPPIRKDKLPTEPRTTTESTSSKDDEDSSPIVRQEPTQNESIHPETKTNDKIEEKESSNQAIVEDMIGQSVQQEKPPQQSDNHVNNLDSSPTDSTEHPTSLNPARKIDFDELTSLQARESLIKQQYSSLSIQRVYSNILDRSSVHDTLHVAIMKGDEQLVEQILYPDKKQTLPIEMIYQISSRDRCGRTALHIAAYGRNPKIIDLLFLTNRIYYGELALIDIHRLKEDRKKCLLDLKASFGNDIIDPTKDRNSFERDDYRIQAVENWYEKEISRIHRRLELQIESAWLTAISERDSRGMTPLHYCVCSKEYNNSKINSLSVLEALLSPIRGGRGVFMSSDLENSTSPLVSKQKSRASTLGRRTTRVLTDVIWFDSESIYNAATGQEVVTIQDEPQFTSLQLDLVASSKTSNSSSFLHSHSHSRIHTLTKQKLSLSNQTSRSSIDPNLFESSSELSLAENPRVDYEVIIPWLIRNIYKRASVMGERLGSSPVDILEELVELVDSNFTRTLIVPEIKDFLKSLGIMVTDDIIKELCNMYPGSNDAVQEKWKTINQYLHFQNDDNYSVNDSDDESNEGEGEGSGQGEGKGMGNKGRGRANLNVGLKKSTPSSKKSTKDSKQKKAMVMKQNKISSPTKKSSKSNPIMSDLDDDDDDDRNDNDLNDLNDDRVEVAESKKQDRKRKEMIMSHPEEEDYGLDFNKLVDDIATGRGMKSISITKRKDSSHHTPIEPTAPLPSNQEDILLDLQNTASSTQTQSLLISFDSRLDLPQTIAISTIQRYRKFAVNVVDENSSTPLLIATALNRREMVDMLLSSGGDITITSTDGHTPLTVATDHLIIANLEKKLMKLLKKNKNTVGRTTKLETTHLNSSSSNLFGQKTVHEFGLTLTETSIPSRLEEPTLQLSRSCGNSHGLFVQLQHLHQHKWNYSKTPLSWAIEGGLDDILHQLIELGANVKEGDAMSRTPLHHCVSLASQISIQQRVELEEAISTILKLRSIAEVLLTGGADIMAKTVSGRTPLHEMFCKGDDLSYSNIFTNKMKLLTDGPTQTLERTKALFVRSLLQWGSDPTVLDRHGYGAIHYCVRENMTSCLIEILKHVESDPHLAIGCCQRNILHVACFYGCEEAAEIICKWDADETDGGFMLAKDSNGKAPKDLLAKDMNSQCLVTIWSACREGNPLRVNQILTRKKNTNVWDHAEEAQSRSVNFETSNPNLLQSSFQDLWLLDGVEAKTRRKRLTPLHCAVIGWAEWSARTTGNLCAKRVLGLPLYKKQFSSTSSSPKKKEKNRTMDSFTQKAASYGTVVSVLLQNFAYVDSMDHKGRTPLMYAAAANLGECLQLLVQSKSDLNRVDSLGNSALHYAYAYGSIAAASFLEEKGADSDLENTNGQTPLAIAGITKAVPDLKPSDREGDVYCVDNVDKNRWRY